MNISEVRPTSITQMYERWNHDPRPKTIRTENGAYQEVVRIGKTYVMKPLDLATGKVEKNAMSLIMRD